MLLGFLQLPQVKKAAIYVELPQVTKTGDCTSLRFLFAFSGILSEIEIRRQSRRPERDDFQVLKMCEPVFLSL